VADHQRNPFISSSMRHFAIVARHGFENAVGGLRPKRFSAGSMILRQGALGKTFCIV
jgi:hypothetical protein